MRGRGKLAAALAFAALALTAGLATAVTGELSFRDCLAEAGAEGCAATAQPAITDPVDVAVSPDNKSVYVVATLDDAVSRFSRNRSTGKLTYQGCVADSSAEGCSVPAQAALDGASGVAVSPDGKSVYVTSSHDDSITYFIRNTANGALTFQGCHADTGAAGCTVPEQAALDGARSVAVSEDGNSVYVTSNGEDSITRFDRDAGGTLGFEGCFADTAAAGCAVPSNAALNGAYGLAISPDGGAVLVASNVDDSLSNFKREPNGVLTYQSCFADTGAAGCTVPANAVLQEALRVAISRDSSSVYLISEADDSLSHFARNTASGALLYQGCFAATSAGGCNVPGDTVFDDPFDVTASPDDTSVYVADLEPGEIAHYTRNPVNGALSYRECVGDDATGGCSVPAHPALDGLARLAVSPDPRSLYAIGESDAAISHFRRERPPCAGQGTSMTGTGGADRLTGTDGPDVIAGLGGNDVIRGLAGNDVICGGKGRDRLVGGKGRDRLLGQAGRDRLKGGAGRDRLKGGPGLDLLRGGPGRDKQVQ